ncbi:protein jim lovell [Drosophila sulfurigaster albostrigata]|uniref:protein jim lovell n=1 Tax=Drosophila sulfurigaster albostrigata TaxID=89887 RepID=UPI002D2185EA|nr:protein jim lovell [Drosophila sulfurigaster albostrigata]
MLKDAEELIKRCKLTSLPLALHMNDYGRQVAPAPLALPLPLPLPLPLLAKPPTTMTTTASSMDHHHHQQQHHHPHHHQLQQHHHQLPPPSHSQSHAHVHATPPTTPPTPPPLPLNMSQTATATAAASATATTTATTAATSITTATATSSNRSTHSPPATPTTIGANSTAPQDHYSLRWNNHQNHILRAFDALLQTKTLVDVTLVCAETSIRAHKMVLSACSPFFQRVFAETPCKHPVIVLKDFRGWVVQAIVDFMYRGEISVPQQRLQTLIQAGESLQVRGLVESSVPEHTPTPAASPDDFNLLDTSLLSSSFEDESPSMVRPAAGKLIMPSRLFGNPASAMAALSLRRKREQESERELESDQELGGSSPMPRRKQARPRRRSGDVPHDFALNKTSETSLPAVDTIQAVIKHELRDDQEPSDKQRDGEDSPMGEEDEPPQSQQQQQQQSNEPEAEHETELEDVERGDRQQDKTGNSNQQTEQEIDEEDDEDQAHDHELDPEQEQDQEHDDHEHDHDHEHVHDLVDDEGPEQDEDEDEQDIEELIHTTNELRRQAAVAAANAAAMSPCPSDGPEDLCTTKKDKDTSNSHSSDGESNNNNNNNNSSKLQDNNQRIMLSLKDIRQLNAKPNATSTPSHTPNSCTPGNGLLSFPPPGLRPPGLPDSPPCHMEALEAQMHAAAAAAVAAAGAGEHPFHHMEHQMEMSLAAAAAAAAMHQREPRDPRETREQAMQREHNAFASNLLGPMGLPPFGGHNGVPLGGPGSGCPGQAPHERLEESMNRLSKEFGKEFGKDFGKEFGKDFGKDFCKEFAPTSPMSLPGHFNPPDGQPHPPSPLPFPGMSSALTLTPPHMFGLDSPLGLFPPGIDPGKLYNPLMEMSDPRDMPGGPPPFLKKKMPRPKGQHSAPRGGPPRSWTNTELTEALQHVWNKKMTTSQASRIFGIPYNSLLMYVRGKYGKSLKLEQLRKDCISGPPIEMLQMGISGGGGGSSKSEKKERKEKDKDKNGSGSNSANSSGNNGSAGNPNASGPGGPPPLPHPNDLGPLGPLDLELGLPLGPPAGPRSGSSEPDLLSGPNALFNPFNPQGFYPDFAGGFPGLPLSMLNLLPPAERHHAAVAMHHLGVSMDEDCKSVGSKQSSSLDDDFAASGLPLALEQRRHSEVGSNGAQALAQANGAGQD